MDPTTELQEPDEARPAKRMRLDAPLEITEDVQEEVIDDGDWDDIYDTVATPAKDASSEGDVPVMPEPDVPSEAQEGAEKVKDGLPAEALDEGDELVAQETMPASTDEPSAKMLGETAEVEVGAVHKHESPEDGQEGQGSAQVNENGVGGAKERLTESEKNTPLKESDAVAEATRNGHALRSNSQPAEDPEFLAAAVAQKDNAEAEWQFDSSDAESSSDSESESGSDDSSDGSESGSEGGYEMLDPAAAAKILMSGEGDDDDGDKDKNKTGDHQPRTTNEVKEVIVPKPDVTVTEDMKITLLGTVDSTIENVALIKAVTPGEFQVLESGSVLCNEKREVIGAVAETLGRVQEPMYSVAFTNAQDIEDMGMKYGEKIYYVDSHSTFVFTQPLKNMKGTDASNIHDEEVGEDELEFSDDEAEAEYKKQKKLAKRGGRGGLSRSAFNEERSARSFGAPGHDSGQTFINGSDAPQQSYGGGLSYDDGNVQDEFYSPLKRPDNLSQLMASGGQLPPRPMHGQFDRGRGRGRGDRGRGDRGRGRNDRGRGRGQGGFERRDQRGGRGAHDQGGPNRGAHGQQSGHRGSAHSFPDRHNNDRRNGHQQHPVRNEPNRQHSPPRPPSQQLQYQQYQSPTSNQQQYQFNGYTFQYGSPPPQVPSQAAYYSQPHPAQSPASTIPPGAYVNPAFFQNQQQQSQWAQPQVQQPQQAAYAWPGQPQQNQYAQHGQAQLTQQQQNNLADILRQFGGQQQR